MFSYSRKTLLFFHASVSCSRGVAILVATLLLMAQSATRAVSPTITVSSATTTVNANAFFPSYSWAMAYSISPDFSNPSSVGIPNGGSITYNPTANSTTVVVDQSVSWGYGMSSQTQDVYGILDPKQPNEALYSSGSATRKVTGDPNTSHKVTFTRHRRTSTSIGWGVAPASVTAYGREVTPSGETDYNYPIPDTTMLKQDDVTDAFFVTVILNANGTGYVSQPLLTRIYLNFHVVGGANWYYIYPNISTLAAYSLQASVQ